MSENQKQPVGKMEKSEESKASTEPKPPTAPIQGDQQSPQQYKRQAQQQQKSPSLLRSRTSSTPISSTNPNVTSHPLHATNLSLSSPSSSIKSSPMSSFRTHFQASASTTTASSPSSLLRSGPSGVPASSAASAAVVPTLVGSVPKTPPRRRSKLNPHRNVLDMHLHIPDMASTQGNSAGFDAPFSPVSQGKGQGCNE